MPIPVLLLPGATRMMDSLRDVGYDLPTSIADLVDNSIEAGATVVEIDFVYNAADSYVRIHDNGMGMSDSRMLEALRYGTRRKYVKNSLGKFGFGLKTASLSHCRKLYVASKESKSLSIMMWDMDHVEFTDRWEALSLTPEEVDPELLEKLKPATSGTTIMWKVLDRETTGSGDKDTFLLMCRKVEEHLAMVFHRFLERKAQRKIPLTLILNGNEIVPWDPFATTEAATRALSSSEFTYQYRSERLKATVQPYILPPERFFSSKTAHSKAAGPKKWNRAQGFYIYRNDRMIQNGGWNRIRAADEHTKLARIAIDFTTDEDESFKIDIAKMAVQIPVQIKPELTKFASTIANAADRIYREGSGTRKASISTSAPKPTSGTNSNSPNPASKADNSEQKAEPDRQTGSPNKPSQITGSNELVDAVITTLKSELFAAPDLLRRILISLAKARPEFRIE